MDIEEIKNPVRRDFEAVNSLTREYLSSSVDLIGTITNYLIDSGGKRLRPLIVLLFSKACGYAGNEHSKLAVVIEFIHTATLLHDDVIDMAKLRRGFDTANNKWGNDAAVLVGDFLYSRCFQLLLTLNKHSIMDVIANATNRIAEGEVQQLLNKKNFKLSQEDYLSVIEAKTAKLFSAATQSSAILADTSEELQAIAKMFGEKFGIAYQLTDDLLDYLAPKPKLGKNLGQDFLEGKATLPIIYLMKNGTPEIKEIIENGFARPDSINLIELQNIVRDSGADEYVRSFVKKYVDESKLLLHELPATEFRQSLERLTNFIYSRDY